MEDVAKFLEKKDDLLEIREQRNGYIVTINLYPISQLTDDSVYSDITE